jgi:hypothetical protein
MQSEQCARHQRERQSDVSSALSMPWARIRCADVAPSMHHAPVRERAPPRPAAISLVETAVSNLERRRVDDGGTS